MEKNTGLGERGSIAFIINYVWPKQRIKVKDSRPKNNHIKNIKVSPFKNRKKSGKDKKIIAQHELSTKYFEL